MKLNKCTYQTVLRKEKEKAFYQHYFEVKKRILGLLLAMQTPGFALLRATQGGSLK